MNSMPLNRYYHEIIKAKDNYKDIKTFGSEKLMYHDYKQIKRNNKQI